MIEFRMSTALRKSNPNLRQYDSSKTRVRRSHSAKDAAFAAANMSGGQVPVQTLTGRMH
jgi:hypothetical protein